MSSNPPEYILVKLVGTLSCAQIDVRNARERELATIDKKSTNSSSGIAGPYAR